MTKGRFHKFAVEHHERGTMDPDDVFVLVPPRDPAAVAAIRTYAEKTPDVLLACDLERWADELEGLDSEHDHEAREVIETSIRLWAGILSEEVRHDRMTIETALQRISGHVMAAMEKSRR